MKLPDPKDIPQFPVCIPQNICTCRKRWETWRTRHQRYCGVADATERANMQAEEPLFGPVLGATK